MSISRQIKDMVLQELLKLELGLVKAVSVPEDKSALWVKVCVLPEEREIVAKMSWDSLGSIEFPSTDDLVIVGYVEQNIDSAFVLGTVNNKIDKIPAQALDGSKVTKSLDGKTNWIVSDSKVNIARGEAEPAENLVLGQALKTYLISLHDKIKEISEAVSTHTHIGNVGSPTSPPKEAADFVMLGADIDSIKSSEVDSEKILSDFSFTEK